MALVGSCAVPMEATRPSVPPRRTRVTVLALAIALFANVTVTGEAARLRGRVEPQVANAPEVASMPQTAGLSLLGTDRYNSRYEAPEHELGEDALDDAADNNAEDLLDADNDAAEDSMLARAAEDDREDIAMLQRVGRRIDANNDTKLSSEELKDFAEALRSKQWWDQTYAVHSASDLDANGGVTLEELRSSNAVHKDLPEHQAARFHAADVDGDGALSRQEMHAFLHPELGGRVLEVEVLHQYSIWDVNADGTLDFKEFRAMGESHGEDFSEEVGKEDFSLHDDDNDGKLSVKEFGKLLQGHELLLDSIEKAIGSADSDGDGHIHVDHEVPHRLGDLLQSEFIEDFFFHTYAEEHHHHEL